MPRDDRSHQLAFDLDRTGEHKLPKRLMAEIEKLRNENANLYRQNLELRDQLGQLIRIAARAIDDANQLHWEFKSDQ